MLTWSFGCTGFFEPISPPSISIARFEITSLAFMFDWVPEPVCQTTSGKWSSSLPAATSAGRRGDRLAELGSRLAGRHVHLGRGLLDDAERAARSPPAASPSRSGSSGSSAGSARPSSGPPAPPAGRSCRSRCASRPSAHPLVRIGARPSSVPRRSGQPGFSPRFSALARRVRAPRAAVLGSAGGTNDGRAHPQPGVPANLILNLRALMAQEELVSPRLRLEPHRRRGPGDAAGRPRQPDPGRARRRDRGPRARPAGRAGGADVDRSRRHGARGVGGGAGAGRRAPGGRRPPTYLLAHPHVADYIDEGVDRLLDGTDLMETGEY